MKYLRRVDKFPCLPYIIVRGKEIDITPVTINSIYWEEPIALGRMFVEKIAIKSQQLQWVANIIAVGQLIVIDLYKKRDVDVPKSKKVRMQSWDVPKSFLAHDPYSAPLEQDLDDSTLAMSGHVSEDVPPPRSSPPPPLSRLSGLQKLAQMTYANDNQLTKLAKNFLALIQRSVKNTMKDVFDNLNKL
ncbi:hypothetical protein HAX54_042188 [Datura stramonium]|uniref:Uncharacterized protein n=1 Tax=Datura stramonium TaxID=4076 RepID=A0ABS8SM86_DATST|nr:hypothetical protein [Datura stramonium]